MRLDGVDAYSEGLKPTKRSEEPDRRAGVTDRERQLDAVKSARIDNLRMQIARNERFNEENKNHPEG